MKQTIKLYIYKTYYYTTHYCNQMYIVMYKNNLLKQIPFNMPFKLATFIPHINFWSLKFSIVSAVLVIFFM